MNIIEKLLSINPFSRPGTKLKNIKNIVIHWVGNAGSSALGNRNYFESLKDKGIYASAHYIIGLNGEIIRCIPEDEMAYHAGNWNINCNSIGIENCHPDWGGKFNDNTYNSLVELIVDICKRYGLNENAIIRHYDVTGKVCPKYYVENQSAFEQLKADVASKLGNSYTPKVITSTPATTNNNYDTYKVCYNGTNVRIGASLGSNVAYQKNAGNEIHVVGQENGFYKLTDGNYIRVGYAYKVSSGNASKSNYSTGTYKTLNVMKVRDGIWGRQKTYNELSSDGKKHALSNGCYRQGTVFTALEIINHTDGSVWARGYSGYVCIKDNSNTYCVKV